MKTGFAGFPSSQTVFIKFWWFWGNFEKKGTEKVTEDEVAISCLGTINQSHELLHPLPPSLSLSYQHTPAPEKSTRWLCELTLTDGWHYSLIPFYSSIYQQRQSKVTLALRRKPLWIAGGICKHLQLVVRVRFQPFLKCTFLLHLTKQAY